MCDHEMRQRGLSHIYIYTANWVIICYLSPFTTWKICWSPGETDFSQPQSISINFIQKSQPCTANKKWFNILFSRINFWKKVPGLSTSCLSTGHLRSLTPLIPVNATTATAMATVMPQSAGRVGRLKTERLSRECSNSNNNDDKNDDKNDDNNNNTTTNNNNNNDNNSRNNNNSNNNSNSLHIRTETRQPFWWERT